MYKNNKGLSLIELLVAVAIMAIVGAVVLMFLNSGFNSYTRTETAVSLESEAQRAMNQIQEMLIDATNGVTYSVNQTGFDVSGQFYLKKEEPDHYHQLCIFNQKDFKGINGATTDTFSYWHIYYDAAGKRLLCTQYEYPTDESGLLKAPVLVDNAAILAKYVEEFTVDLSELGEKQQVRIKMTFQVKNKTFTADKVIVVRNKMMTESE